MKDNNEKMVQLIVKEILKLLIDQQIGQNNNTGLLKSQLRAFKAKQRFKNNQSNNWQSLS